VLAGDGTSRALGAGDALAPDARLTAALAAAAPGARTGRVVSSDLVYDPDPGRARAWESAGALAIEMEAATLLAVAARRGVAAACVLAVSDLVATRSRIGDEALEAAEAELGRAGLAALRR
jgi:purine-nucleoside phosphorylase